MTTWTCETARDRLAEYAADRLTDAEAAVLLAHLETCAECRAEYEVVRMLTTPAPAMPADFEARVLRAVRSRRQPLFSPARLAMAATVVFALVTAGVISQTGLLDNGRSPSDEVPATFDWTRGDPVLLRGGLDLSALSEDELLKLLEEMDS